MDDKNLYQVEVWQDAKDLWRFTVTRSWIPRFDAGRVVLTDPSHATTRWGVRRLAKQAVAKDRKERLCNHRNREVYHL